MNDFNANFYTVIISVLAAVVSIISLVISWISYRSDRYKIKTEISFGDMERWPNTISPNDLNYILELKVFNQWKRAVSIDGIDFITDKWLLKSNHDRKLLFFEQLSFPIRLNENEWFDIKIIAFRFFQKLITWNYKLKAIEINSQDGEKHKIIIKKSKYNKMISHMWLV